MKPLITWPGGKADEVDVIRQHMPPADEFETYVEPFFGGGALFFATEPRKAALGDTHADLVHFYHQVRAGHGPAMHARMSRCDHSKDEYYRVRDAPATSSDDDVERAFRFWYVRKHCYRGMLRYNRAGKFNGSYGFVKNVDASEMLDERYAELLSRASVTVSDFETVMRDNDSERNFCFIDPPYDGTFASYGGTRFSDEDHRRLSECFKSSKMKCIVVVADSDYMRDLYRGYVHSVYPKSYRLKIHSGRIGDDINRNHLIIKNF